MTLLPFSLIGPFTGPFIDRFSRRSILIGSSAVRAVLTVALVASLGGPEWLVLGLAVATISVNRFFHATKGAVLPTLVAPGQYLTANAVSTTGGMVFGLAGAVVGGPVADAAGPTVVVAVAAVGMIVAAAIAATLHLPRGERRGLAGFARELREDLRDVAEGLRTLRRSRRATYGVAAVWTMRALLGFVLIAALVLLRSRFDARTTGFSLILGMVGVGGFVGAVTVWAVARRVGHTGVAPLAFVVAGLAGLVLIPIPSWGSILGAVFVAGMAMSSTKIASDTLVQSGIEDRFRGRAFAVYDIGYNGAFVVAALIPTLLFGVLGDIGIIVLTAALAVVAAAALARWRRRVPPLVEVEAHAGGRADETLRHVTLDGVRREVEEVERVELSQGEGASPRRVLQIRLAGGERLRVSADDGGWTAEPLR